MSENQQPQPASSRKLDELTQRLAGVEAALQAAVRNSDDQEWREWLERRRDALKAMLAKEQIDGSIDRSGRDAGPWRL